MREQRRIWIEDTYISCGLSYSDYPTVPSPRASIESSSSTKLSLGLLSSGCSILSADADSAISFKSEDWGNALLRYPPISALYILAEDISGAADIVTVPSRLPVANIKDS